MLREGNDFSHVCLLTGDSPCHTTHDAIGQSQVTWNPLSYVSGGSRISPRRGRQLSGGAPTYNFAKFSQKLHEIERTWTPGGARPKFYYVDPPLYVLASLPTWSFPEFAPDMFKLVHLGTPSPVLNTHTETSLPIQGPPRLLHTCSICSPRHLLTSKQLAFYYKYF